MAAIINETFIAIVLKSIKLLGDRITTALVAALIIILVRSRRVWFVGVRHYLGFSMGAILTVASALLSFRSPSTQ